MSSDSPASLPYHEPSIEQILIQTSFLLLLNVGNWALDRLIYCGLVGQILVGVAWGTPGAKLLSVASEDTFVQLGYLGLLLLVFEGKCPPPSLVWHCSLSANFIGGLATSLPAVRANLLRSASVATTGIAAPIALSFVLAPMAGASYLECFAAGAALCSTSLGTTFTVLRSCGLSTTRLGVVLTSAAMLDDVVGLVMVQVIANLGQSGGGEGGRFSAVTIVRPVLVSIGFAVVSVVVCRFVVLPVRTRLYSAAWAQPGTRIGTALHQRETKLVVATALLVGLATGATYAGTSNLFAAYIAGAVLGWWDALEAPPSHQPEVVATPPPPRCTSADLFEEYFHPAVKWVLQPYFFASVGFSIPITRMFAGPIVWKGIVYSVLMGLAKLLCGVWLVRMPSVARLPLKLKKKKTTPGKKKEKKLNKSKKSDETEKKQASNANNGTGKGTGRQAPAATGVVDTTDASSSSESPPSPESPVTDTPHATPAAPTPFSLYPAAILGLAMVPRGEIGFLISSVASSNGVFAPEESSSSSSSTAQSDVFLIATWAIVLCTVVGPLSVGLLVRRVKRLSAGQDGSSRNPLGVWGVS